MRHDSIPSKFRGFQSIGSMLKKTVEKIEANAISTRTPTGMPTGLTELDSITNGLHRSELILLGARPGMGSETLALNIAENVLLASQRPVIVFSMESSAITIARKLLSSNTGIPLRSLQYGNMSEQDWSKVSDSINTLENRRLYIDDTSSMTINHIRECCHRLSEEIYEEPGLIIIDNLQWCEMNGKAHNEVHQPFQMMKALKELAEEFDMTVIALTGLKRELEERINKQPCVTDIPMDSAAIHIADTILFIYFEYIYNEEAENDKAEIIVTYQRGGATGSIPIRVNFTHSRFKDLMD